MSEKLKPCPFCGGKPHILDDLPEYCDVEHPGYYVYCPKDSLYFGYTEAFGGEFSTEREAVRAWNRRVNHG
ncbi:MAG: Lar family restriction alleviation protein [Synergistaceae bacterium]|nr:Lar family restriction alleviation protein [Synergistaceae bacterium]